MKSSTQSSITHFTAAVLSIVKFSANEARAESKSPASLPAGWPGTAPEIIVVGGAGLKTGVELNIDEFPIGFNTSPKGSKPLHSMMCFCFGF